MDAVTVFVIVVAGLLGLAIGSFLNVVAYRVPAGIPLTRESRCPHCAAPVRWWQNVPVLGWIALRGRCASCATRISARYPIVEAVTGIAFAVVALWFLGPAAGAMPTAASVVVMIAFLALAAVSIVLTLIDLDTHRLPNVIVLPSYLVGGVLLTLACLLGADWWMLARAAIGMAALFAFYFVLRLIRPDGMGGGDVKLAGLLGMHLAWLGWAPLIVGAFGAFLLGGVFGIALLLGRRAHRRTSIPFGPWMIAGAWIGVFAGDAIGRFYGGLYAV